MAHCFIFQKLQICALTILFFCALISISENCTHFDAAERGRRWGTLPRCRHRVEAYHHYHPLHVREGTHTLHDMALTGDDDATTTTKPRDYGEIQVAQGGIQHLHLLYGGQKLVKWGQHIVTSLLLLPAIHMSLSRLCVCATEEILRVSWRMGFLSFETYDSTYDS
ncbi:hypothetical protein Micbo1qcDRAFT_31820 [Microdochium bolleyi]|uniref:Uncharacterized protein n=1 Tax=Microdochium bolleyi TaxID=196109 RepID=A0A136IQL4_9PEZI|nr:hypothetical protein Micbo1qcDRAFT_31820 [Microdochium bolleyi]